MPILTSYKDSISRPRLLKRHYGVLIFWMLFSFSSAGMAQELMHSDSIPQVNPVEDIEPVIVTDEVDPQIIPLPEIPDPESSDTIDVAVIDSIPEAHVRISFRDRPHSPLKASLLSATIPGFGQIYNGKYYKLPFIYGGFGTIAYFLKINSDEYRKFRTAYIARVDGNPNTVDEFPEYGENELKKGNDFYRRNLEITYIAAGILYLLNILDATVDAHLLFFDVSEDLTFSVFPSVQPMPWTSRPGGAASFSMILKF